MSLYFLLRKMNFPNSLPIGFIGSGNMGCGIMHGLVQSDMVHANKIVASNSRFNGVSKLKELGISFHSSNQEVASTSKTLMICVKPYLVEKVLSELDLSQTDLIISVAAGITLTKLKNIIGDNNKRIGIIRVMPNTAVAIQEGCAAIASSENTSKEQLEFCKTVFASICKCCIETSEDNIDSMIGISGSGIAYMYIVAESMIDAGVKLGLPRSSATELVCQTMIGAGKMIQQTHLHPMELKDQVTSPGGTTICAVAKLEELGLRNALIQASEIASNKAKELAKNMP